MKKNMESIINQYMEPGADEGKEEMGANANPHTYFCQFCLEMTVWKTEKDDTWMSECSKCGILGNNYGADCPNIMEIIKVGANGEHFKVRQPCKSKNAYLFCTDKCRPKPS